MRPQARPPVYVGYVCNGYRRRIRGADDRTGSHKPADETLGRVETTQGCIPVPTPSKSSQVCTTRLPNRVADDVRLVAAATGRTPSEIIREAVTTQLRSLRAA